MIFLKPAWSRQEMPLCQTHEREEETPIERMQFDYEICLLLWDLTFYQTTLGVEKSKWI